MKGREDPYMKLKGGTRTPTFQKIEKRISHSETPSISYYRNSNTVDIIEYLMIWEDF